MSNQSVHRVGFSESCSTTSSSRVGATCALPAQRQRDSGLLITDLSRAMLKRKSPSIAGDETSAVVPYAPLKVPVNMTPRLAAFLDTVWEDNECASLA